MHATLPFTGADTTALYRDRHTNVDKILPASMISRKYGTPVSR